MPFAIPPLVYWLVGGSAAALAGGFFIKSTGEAAEAAGQGVENTADAALKLALAAAVAGVGIWAAKKAKVF